MELNQLLSQPRTTDLPSWRFIPVFGRLNFTFTWNDIDFDRVTLSVRKGLTIQPNRAEGKTTHEFTEPKTEKSKREIPLHDEAIEVLKARKARQNEIRKLVESDAYNPLNLVLAMRDGSPLTPNNMTFTSDES